MDDAALALPALLTAADVAARCGVSLDVVYRLIDGGEIPARRVGRGQRGSPGECRRSRQTVAARVSDPRPSRVHRVRRRLRAVALDLAAAVTATLAREGVVRAAEALGVHRDTLHAWRAPGGWLCTTEPREGEP